MTDKLRQLLKPGDFEVLEYFTRDDLRRKMENMGVIKPTTTKVINGFTLGSSSRRSIRQIAELPDSQLLRPSFTGKKAFEIVSEAILGLLKDGWS